MLSSALSEKIALLADKLMTSQLKLGTAESCTGGGLSYVLTSLAGSSVWFERGLITYSNAAKINLLHVSENTLNQYGAVSKETAIEMVEGLLMHHPLDVGVAITGIAGPEGGSEEKPVGTVWIAAKRKEAKTQVLPFLFHGNREIIRDKSIEAAIIQLLLIV